MQGAGEGERQLRILLAEDSPTNQLIATINLEQAGYAVEVVDNGRKAVQALDGGGFDLVLMDVYMPEMDGLEATRTIRRTEETSGQQSQIRVEEENREHRNATQALEPGMKDPCRHQGRPKGLITRGPRSAPCAIRREVRVRLRRQDNARQSPDRAASPV